MAVTAVVYANAILNALEKKVDLETDEIKCMLCTSTYTPDQENHDFKDDITNEVSGTGYTAGGVIIANPAVTISAKVTKFDADDAEWANSTITARYAVIFDNTPAAEADKPVLVLIDFGENKASENGTFKLAFNASGIFTVTVA